MFRNLLVVSSVILVWICIVGCNNPASEAKSNTGDSSTSNVVNENAVQRPLDYSSEERIPPSIEASFPFKWHDHLTFSNFTDHGINAFYALNKRVPKSFDEYISSGFPIMIPNDYVTGKPYHLVESVDLADTTGFTFWSDGVDQCRFEFAINNDDTGQNEIYTKSFTERNFSMYKTIDGVPQILANSETYFDKVKREHCMWVFPSYAYIYMAKHSGGLPNSIAEMLKEEGTPLEAGWKWTPEFPGEYFEFGIDTEKQRYYTIQGSKDMQADRGMAIAIQQMYNEVRVNFERTKGVDIWSFRTDSPPPADIIEMNKYIASDSFYDGYLALTNK